MPDIRGESRFTVPALPPRHIVRPRLLAALDEAVDLPLVLLSAGAGAGKTVLLSDWALRREMPTAWLPLTSDDVTPRRFWQLLVAVLRPDRGDDLPPVVPRASTIDMLCSLLSGMPGAPTPLTLVIDDAHLLADPAVLDLLDKLIRASHPRLHLVLSARSDPSLPLHRYRLAGQIRELRTDDLAMTAREIRELLVAHGVRLPPAAFSLLAARTEGWAAGVRLFAMRMQGQPDPAVFAAELALNHGSPGEYLIAEVLDSQPEPLRRLLIETSFLDEVTGPLAEAITGMPGCAEMLAELARSNSFVIATDAAATRFRHHRLFAEVLRHLLPRQARQAVPDLMTRAAASFEGSGDLDQALRWAVGAGDQRHAAALLARGALAHAFTHRRNLPCTELSDLLEAARSAHPDAEFTLASDVLSAVTADAQAAASELRREAGQGKEADPALQLTADLVTLILGIKAGDRRALDAAAGRLSRNPHLPEWPGLRAAVLLAQASAHFWHGQTADVDALLSRALAAAEADRAHVIELDVCAMIAYADSYFARRQHADDVALRARGILGRHRGLSTPPALELAEVIRALAAADFGTANQSLRHTQVPEVVGSDPGLSRALVLGRATLLVSAGQLHEAREILHRASEGPALPLLDVYRDMILANIETALGRPHAAIRLLQGHHDGGFTVLVAVPRARAFLALHDVRSAENCTRSVLAAASAQLSPRVLVDAMLCEAQIAQVKGDRSRAVEMVAGALDVADGELVLPFLRVTDEFATLLAHHPALAIRWPAPPGRGIASSLADRLPPEAGVGSGLLTQREYAVLHFLATSMTTAEIADELCLSVNTVKTHLAAIYRKLAASKRREAVLRARELELI